MWSALCIQTSLNFHRNSLCIAVYPLFIALGLWGCVLTLGPVLSQSGLQKSFVYIALIKHTAPHVMILPWKKTLEQLVRHSGEDLLAQILCLGRTNNIMSCINAFTSLIEQLSAFSNGLIANISYSVEEKLLCFFFRLWNHAVMIYKLLFQLG